MKHRAVSALRRLAAWMTSLLMLLSPLALPALALTQDEINAMPTVTLFYQLAEDGETLSMAATPTSDSFGKAYWAMLPAEAFSYPVTLSVTANPNYPYTFTPEDGAQVFADAGTVDYSGAYTAIDAYQDDMFVEEYHLYVSPAEMPLEVSPADVPVYYVDADDPGVVLYSTTFTAYYNIDNVVVVDPSLVPSDYTFVGQENGVYVSVDEYGQASPSSVTFSFRMAAQQGTLTVYYVDDYGNTFNSETRTLDPGSYDITPDYNYVPDGYTLTGSDTQPVTVENSGVTSPDSVTFTFAQPVYQGTLTVYYVRVSELKVLP